MKYPEIQSRTVVITGCSSGIGASTAGFLRDHGWDVIPTVRKEDDFARLEAEGFRPVYLDLGNGESVSEAAVLVLRRWDGRLGAVVNNSGFAQPGAVEDLSRDALRAQFEVNVFGTLEFTRQLIPSLRALGAGRIVNVSSVLGRLVLPFIGAYAASKHALEACSDALRVELRSSGVAVSLVEPGAVDTSFRANSAAHASNLMGVMENSHFKQSYELLMTKQTVDSSQGDAGVSKPLDVAKVIRRALESSRPKARYPVSVSARVAMAAQNIMPDSMVDKLVEAYWSRLLRRQAEPSRS